MVCLPFFTYIYHKNSPKCGIYFLHGSYWIYLLLVDEGSTRSILASDKLKTQDPVRSASRIENFYGFAIRLVQNFPSCETNGIGKLKWWSSMFDDFHLDMFCLLGIVGIVPKRFGQGRLGAERERHGRHGLCKWRFFVEGTLGMYVYSNWGSI